MLKSIVARVAWPGVLVGFSVGSALAGCSDHEAASNDASDSSGGRGGSTGEAAAGSEIAGGTGFPSAGALGLGGSPSGGGGGSGVAGRTGLGVGQGDPDPALSAPALDPKLLVLTYLGGAGDQYFSEAGFDAAGNPFAKADGFTLTYDAETLVGSATGDVSAAMDISKFPVNYPLPKGGLSTNQYKDPRNGQTYTWGTHPNVAHGGTICPDQCNGLCKPGDTVAAFLQMAFVTSDKGWKLWDFTWDNCVQACEVADSRGYDLWPSAGGKVGVMLWTDGGDTPLRHDPRDVSKPPAFLDGAFGDSPGGRGVLFALIDPTTGTVPSGTFLNTHAVFHTHDDWGRVYLPKSIPIRYGKSDKPNPTNPWAQSASAETGLFVLNSDFKEPEFHAYIGGDRTTCAGANPTQSFDAIARRGKYLVMAGTTCATNVATTANAAQKALGGGQDGLMAVVQLWD